MGNKTLMGESHSDHRKVVESLLELRMAIQEQDLSGMKSTLQRANKLAGLV